MAKTKALDAFFTGIIISVDNIFAIFAFSSLIFQGVLTQYISLGVSFFIISTLIVGLGYALQASIPYAIAQLHDEAVILYSAMAMSLVGSLPTNLPPQTLFLTVITTIGMATFIVGLVFYLIGRFNLGNIIRYLPFPVMGGFLAATGWLIFYGCLQLMLGQQIAKNNWVSCFSPDALLHWLPAFLIGLLVYILNKKNYRYILQVILLTIVIIFYSLLYFLNLSPSSPEIHTYMLDSFAESNNQWLFTTQYWDLSLLQFSLTQFNYVGLVFFVSFIALLLNAGSVELVIGDTVDLNRELRIAGKLNIFSGLFGGLVGYLSLSATRLAKQQRAKGCWTGIIAVIPLLLIFYFGMNAASYLPKIVIGSFLFYIAFNFLNEWLITTWKSLNLLEYSIIIFILITSIVFNMLTAVLMGTIISIFIFAFRYSLVLPVKNSFSGVIYRSAFQRSPELNSTLTQHGAEIHYLKLQGFLFFGSIYTLYNVIKNLVECKYIILDFDLVDNIDSSRIILLKNLKQMANKKNSVLLLCHLKPKLAEELTKLGEFDADSSWIKIVADKEEALQWCEEQVLTKHGLKELSALRSFDEQLINLGFPEEFIHHVKPIAIRKNYSANDLICREGDAAMSIYIVHRGTVSVLVGNQNVFTVSSGTILGEVAMYTDRRRSATLKANEETVIYEIAVESINKLAQVQPSFVGAFHECMANILAGRLIEQNKKVRLFSAD